MKCPNCGQRSKRLINITPSTGVSFRKSIEGYFRCRACNVLLKHQKNSWGLTKFKKQYWIYNVALFALLVVYLNFGIFYIKSIFPDLPAWLAFSIITSPVVLFLIFMGYTAQNYALIEISEDEADYPEERKSSILSMISLFLVAVAVIFGFTYVTGSTDISKTHPFLYVSGSFLFLGLLTIIGLYMIKKINEKQDLER
jgi:multisubunit Na+/H+ antiporter MnhC subunit